MGTPLSVDLRERVVSAVEAGLSRRKARGAVWGSMKRDPLDKPSAANW